MSFKNNLTLLLIIECLSVISVLTLEPLPDLSITPRNRTTSEQRINSHGYPSETHQIITTDGYILTIYRIPQSPQHYNKHRPAVVLLHGVTSSSDIFLLNGPNDGLPYLLADAGYDVWLGNARGNVYSRQNRRISANSRHFWRFTWHEIGTIDLAETIDYVLEETGQEAVHLIGHSQGSTIFLVLASMRPEYNEKIKTAQLLAPVAFLRNCRDRKVLSFVPLAAEPGLMSTQFRDREYRPSKPYAKIFLDVVCGGNETQPEYCSRLYELFVGYSSANLNTTLNADIVATHPAGASSNQLIHYAQQVLSDRFRQYDYGWFGNKMIYGQLNPPDYDLSRVTSPVYIYYSDGDDTAVTKDVERLAGELPNVALFHRVTYPDWTHADFVLALDVKKQINDIVIEKFNEFEEHKRVKENQNERSNETYNDK